jgi:uncharacterized protein YycO
MSGQRLDCWEAASSRRTFGKKVLACAAMACAANAEDPPLSPSAGGRSITKNLLEVGDILLTTTSSATTNWISALVSAAIRLATGNGPFSHAAVYVGDAVIESLVSKGVTLNPLDGPDRDAVLPQASVAVALRYPGIRLDQQGQIKDWAFSKLGGVYDFAGTVSEARFQYRGKVHQLINLGVSQNKWYCSKLLLDAYNAGGVSLTTVDPRWQSANDLAPLAWFGELEYVGHLKP